MKTMEKIMTGLGLLIVVLFLAVVVLCLVAAIVWLARTLF